ncbi:MAG: tetratricopeptide repeat protein [Treponema sp.]|nr:tetratricopeptide repeat protein [Treponema sp.]
MKIKKMMKNKRIVVVAVCLFVAPALFGAGNSAAVLEKYNLGMKAQSNESYYEASQYYLEVTVENPAFTDAWYKLAECSYKLGEFDLALQYLENAEKYEKNNLAIQNLKGMVYVSLGRIDDGRNIFNNILKKYPNDIDAHFGLAEIELYEGRFSGAQNQYMEALKRQNTNRKALLSLALVNAERGQTQSAENYLRQALSYYSGEPEVHYLASIIYSMKGDYVTAEKQARIAVEVNSSYDKAYDMLSTILYKQSRYKEVIDISDYLISRNRKNTNAWFIKGVAQCKLGNVSGAIETWTAGLQINPQDEIMRSAMENEIRNTLSLEDSRRSYYAQYHIANAKQYASRYDGSGAVYEYQRALLLAPMNYEARMAYADILEINGMHELYLEQLKFIKENNEEQLATLSKKQQTELNDKIEAFDYLLSDTLGKKWNVEPFYLDKTRWNIAVFYEDNNSTFIHADTNRLVANAAADIFSGVAITSVKTQVTPVSGYGEAFKNSRAGGFDYFIILSLSEGENDMTLSSTMYSGRTGLEISKNSFYCTGNNRFSTVLRRFRNSVLEKLTVRGKILDRNGKTVLVDLGKAENIVKDAQLKIIKKGQIRTADSGVGLYYRDADVLGTITITTAGEEISEGTIENHGFYDKINIDDELVLVSLPAQNANNDANGNAVDNVPAADEKGNAVVKNEVKGEELVEEIRNAVERPSILDLLRNIY